MKKLLIGLILLSVISMAYLAKSQQESAEATVVKLDAQPGSSPYLTSDNRGNTVLSWVRKINDSAAVFCYAISRDEGKTFDAPVVIPSSTNVHPHAENIPKVLFKPSGEIIAAWGAKNGSPRNKYAGLVYYAQSFDGGTTWTKARQLVNDTAGVDQRYFDMALLPNGEAAITWLDNRKAGKKEGSALYFAATTGKEGFVNEKRIQENCCPCCRTDLFVDKNKGIHILYRGIINDTIRDMVHTVSVDDGQTFTDPVRINDDNWVLNACPHTGPSMAENNSGLHFNWYTGGNSKGIFYKTSTNNGSSFTGYEQVSAAGAHPQLTALSNGTLATVWDESISEGSNSIARIGLQLREESGKNIQTIYPAADTLKLSYPVVRETGKGSILIAFCRQEGGKNYVVYLRKKLS